MHYITGTQFTINPQLRRLTPRESALIPGKTYYLFKIVKKDEMFIYTFMDTDRNKIEIPFASCREVDKFIAAYRREKVPDYDAVYERNTDS